MDKETEQKCQSHIAEIHIEQHIGQVATIRKEHFCNKCYPEKTWLMFRKRAENRRLLFSVVLIRLRIHADLGLIEFKLYICICHLIYGASQVMLQSNPKVISAAE